MRIYFLSYKPAILKLNGLYVGGVDMFERHIELELADSVLAEIVPGENLQPVNFFINEKLLFQPPPFLDVYLMENEALLFVREYGNKGVNLRVVRQTRFCGNLVTLFLQGGCYLSVEGAEYSLFPLSAKFYTARFEEKTLCGMPVLAVYGGGTVGYGIDGGAANDSGFGGASNGGAACGAVGGALLILSESGKRIFLNEVEKAEFGERLKITAAFETCTAAKAVCEYLYDGEKLILQNSATIETRPPEKPILHFAFFESVLTRGNFANYLCDDLKDRAGALADYLGEFVGVTVPTEKFYAEHPNLRATGLVYPKASNLYEVKYFAVELDETSAKITNIFPV